MNFNSPNLLFTAHFSKDRRRSLHWLKLFLSFVQFLYASKSSGQCLIVPWYVSNAHDSSLSPARFLTMGNGVFFRFSSLNFVEISLQQMSNTFFKCIFIVQFLVCIYQQFNQSPQPWEWWMIIFPLSFCLILFIYGYLCLCVVVVIVVIVVIVVVVVISIVVVFIVYRKWKGNRKRYISYNI